MLEFAESLLKEVRRLRTDAETVILNGTISDFERYRFMMGRLEGLKLAEEAIREIAGRYSDDLD